LPSNASVWPANVVRSGLDWGAGARFITDARRCTSASINRLFAGVKLSGGRPVTDSVRPDSPFAPTPNLAAISRVTAVVEIDALLASRSTPSSEASVQSDSRSGDISPSYSVSADCAGIDSSITGIHILIQSR
jgi:hypothetical protein